MHLGGVARRPHRCGQDVEAGHPGPPAAPRPGRSGADWCLGPSNSRTPKRCLQRLHLPADGAVGDVQLRRRRVAEPVRPIASNARSAFSEGRAVRGVRFSNIRRSICRFQAGRNPAIPDPCRCAPVSIVPVLGLGQIVAFASSYYLLGVLADPMAQTLRPGAIRPVHRPVRRLPDLGAAVAVGGPLDRTQRRASRSGVGASRLRRSPCWRWPCRPRPWF